MGNNSSGSKKFHNVNILGDTKGIYQYFELFFQHLPFDFCASNSVIIYIITYSSGNKYNENIFTLLVESTINLRGFICKDFRGHQNLHSDAFF